MITKIATRRVLVVIVLAVFVTGSLAKAAEGCGTLSQGTNGTREVLIPDPQSSSIPSDLLTTPPSVTDDHRAPLDVVDEDDDCCGNHQATAAWIYRTEGREEEEDDDDKDSITLENTLVGLTFEAAVFLMVSSIQPRGNSSLLATWSPSWSPSWSMSPPPPPPMSLSSASLPITMARVAIVIGLTFSLIAQMMLRRGHTTAANVCKYACILSVAVAFFSMTSVFVADRFAWVLWVAGGVLVLVFAYSISLR